jgi:CspA family cold shock protein
LTHVCKYVKLPPVAKWQLPSFLTLEVRCVAKRSTGVVRWFDGSKGYGYINSEDGEEVFVHHSAIANLDTPFLSAGESVAFSFEQTVRGPQALEVTRLN